MIAAGFCMMGGCFAQEENSAAVETYWPAHAVEISQTIIFMPISSELLLPFWGNGVRAGGRFENFVRPSSSTKNNVLNWGAWGWIDNVYALDALYLGCGYDKNNGPSAYAVCNGGVSAIACVESEATFFPFAEIEAEDNKFCVYSWLGSANGEVDSYPSNYTVPWQIRVKLEAGEKCDLVSFWWSNSVIQKKFFMVQPMRSPGGVVAFFTHGFNRLMEL